MKNRIVLFLILLLIFSCDTNKNVPVDLKTEYSINPLGIDTDLPRFSWKLPQNSNVKRQLFYQVLVADKIINLKENKSLVWDSGKIKSDKNFTVFDGNESLPNTRYFWVVKIWDNNGNESSYSIHSSFHVRSKSSFK